MSARDDYPYWPAPSERRFSAEGSWHWSVAMDEIDRLRAWKESAMIQLHAWDTVWEAAGRPGPLGGSKAHSTRDEIERLLLALEAHNQASTAEIDRLRSALTIARRSGGLSMERVR